MGQPLEVHIRKLQEFYWSEADPEGRGFVPLADALRKAGEFLLAPSSQDFEIAVTVARGQQYAVARGLVHDEGERLPCAVEPGAVEEEQLGERRILLEHPVKTKGHRFGQRGFEDDPIIFAISPLPRPEFRA